jgi:hypothetical protein
MRHLKTYTLFERVKTKIILPVINERKSDRISMELSRFVVVQFKKREDFVMNGITFERGDEYARFDMSCVFIKNNDFNHPFSINASSDSESLDIEVTFREKDFPKHMNDFIAEIKETIEHEIEHIEQQNFEDMEVEYNDLDDDNYKYLTSNQEVPAYVRGLIKRAQTKRITLSAAMDEWFEENKLNFKNPNEEWPIIKSIWMEEANKRIDSKRGFYKSFHETLDIQMRYLKTYKIFESNKDEYHDLMMVLNDLFDDFGILSHSNERFGDDNDDYPEHSFWAFRNSVGQDIMTNNVDLMEEVKDIVIYNILNDDRDRFWNELMSYKEQIEEVTGKNFIVYEEEINNLFYDYILRLI